MALEVELGLSSRFSNSFYENNFHASLAQISVTSKVGVSSLLADAFDGSRHLHWRAGAGCVCLHEIWVNQDIDDNALVLRLGDENTGAPIAVSIDSEPDRNAPTTTTSATAGFSVSIRFLMKNGSIVRLQLSSSRPTLSVLAHFVELTQGDALDCTAQGGAAAGADWVTCYSIEQCDSPTCGVFTGGDSCVIANTGTQLTAIQVQYQSAGIHGARASGTENTLSISESSEGNVLNRLWGMVQGNGGGSSTSQPSVLACAYVEGGVSGVSSATAVIDTAGTLRVWDMHSCICQHDVQSVLGDLLTDSRGVLATDDAILAPLTDSNGDKDIICGLRCRVDIGSSGGQYVWHILHLRFDANWTLTHSDIIDCSNTVGGSVSLLALQPLWGPAGPEGGTEFVIASQWVHVDTGLVTHVLSSEGGGNAIISAPQAKHRHMMAAEDSRLSSVVAQKGGWASTGADGSASANGGGSSELATLQAARVLRLFAPGRFSVRLVLTTLVLDLPVPVSVPDISTVPVAIAAELVLKACGQWVQKLLIDDEDAESNWNNGAADYAMNEDVEDDGRYTEAMDCVLLDFTRLCHLRASRELEKSARSSYLASPHAQHCAPSLVTIVARADSVSLVLAAPESHPTPSSKRVVSNAKLRAKALQMVQDALHPAALAEFWLSLELRLQETAIVDASLLQWLTTRMEELTTECQHLAPGLQALLGCVTYDTDFFDSLLVIFGELRMPSNGGRVVAVTVGNDYADLTENDQYATTGCSSSGAYTTALAAGLALAVLREQAQEALFVAALTALMSGAAAQTAVTLWSRYTTSAVLDVAYAGLLQFLSLVRAQDMTDLRRLVDVQDLCPNSHGLSAVNQNGSATVAAAAASVSGREKGNNSAFHGLWAHGGLGTHLLRLASSDNALLALDVKRAASRCAIAARPSITGPLMAYLASEGQFASMQKLASLLLLRVEVHRETTVVLSNPDDDDDFVGARGANELAEVLLTSRVRSLISIGAFYSSLRALTPYARRGMSPSLAQEHAVKTAVDALLAAAPDRKANEYAEHWQDMVVSAPVDHFTKPQSAADSAQRIVEKKRYFRDDLREWQVSMLAALGPSSSGDDINEEMSLPTSASSTSIAMEADAIRCCADTLSRVVTENESVISIARLHTGVHPTQKMSHMLVEYSSYLQHVAAISHAKDTLEVVKRARAVLGADLGAELCLQAAYSGLEATKFTLEGCADFLDAHEWIRTYHFDDYRTAWARVLNFALEGGRLDEALTAVCSILELDWDPAVSGEDDDVEKSTTGAGLTKPWEVSLRSVVALACESGCLNWLCALPETIIHGISVTDSVAAALTRLAESRSIQPLLDGEDGVCYYECLYAFYCSRKSYRQAAGALRGMASRIAADEASNNASGGSTGGNGATASAVELQAQALAGSIAALAVVPSAQAFLLLPAAVTEPAAAAITATSIAGAAPAGLEMLPRTSLVVDFLVNTAKELYLQSTADTQTLNTLDTVLALCELKAQGPSIMAVNIAWHAVQLASAAHPLLPRPHGTESSATEHLKQAITALALSCGSESQQALEECPTLVQPYPAQITPTTGAMSDIREGNKSIYEPLLDILRTLDSSKEGYALQAHALEVLLTMYPSEAPPAELLAPLNHSQHTHVARKQHPEAPTPVSFGAGADSATSVRKLLASGRLADACVLSKRALSGPGGGQWAPYALLDQVILSSRTALIPGNFKPQAQEDEEDLRQLKQALDALEQGLDEHFAQQCNQ